MYTIKLVIIGFSIELADLNSAATISVLDEMLAAGCNAIQVHVQMDDKPDEQALQKVKGFSYRTIHIPKFRDEEMARQAISTSVAIGRLIDVNDFTMHPNGITDFEWLANEFEDNLNIENMDWRKDFGQTPKDLNKVFKQLPKAGWTFDVNHVKTNDPSIRLADSLYGALADRLRCYHLSGFVDEELPHTLLADTHQDEIIAKVTDLSKPIIIESLGTEDYHRFKEELDYIEARLGK